MMPITAAATMASAVKTVDFLLLAGSDVEATAALGRCEYWGAAAGRCCWCCICGCCCDGIGRGGVCRSTRVAEGGDGGVRERVAAGCGCWIGVPRHDGGCVGETTAGVKAGAAWPLATAASASRASAMVGRSSGSARSRRISSAVIGPALRGGSTLPDATLCSSAMVFSLRPNGGWPSIAA